MPAIAGSPAYIYTPSPGRPSGFFNRRTCPYSTFPCSCLRTLAVLTSRTTWLNNMWLCTSNPFPPRADCVRMRNGSTHENFVSSVDGFSMLYDCYTTQVGDGCTSTTGVFKCRPFDRIPSMSANCVDHENGQTAFLNGPRQTRRA